MLGKLGHAAVVFSGVNQDFVRIEAEHIAQNAQAQRQILIEQGFGRLDFCLFLNVFPHFGQIVNVRLQLVIGGVFSVGTDDVAVAGIFGQQVVEALPQTAAFGIILDTLGNADVVFLRKMDEETAGQ